MARASTYVSGNQAMVPASSPCVFVRGERVTKHATTEDRIRSGERRNEAHCTLPQPSCRSPRNLMRSPSRNVSSLSELPVYDASATP